MNGKDAGIGRNAVKHGMAGLFRKKRYIARPRKSSRAQGGCPGVCGSPGEPGNPGSPGQISVEQVTKDGEEGMAGLRMVFQGKYRFAAWDKSRMIIKADGSLDVMSDKDIGNPISESNPDDRFNLYGIHKNEAVIQAMNGMYISWTPGSGYQADQQDQGTAEVLRMIKKTEELWAFYREDKEKNRYYMNVEDGHLSEISVSQGEELPDTACFHVETVTGSLSRLVLGGARGADLEWADLRYAVLRNVDMTECTMIKTTLACADACGAIFDRAFMNQCDFGNMDCRGASFIKASLIQCKAKDLNGAKGTFTQAVLRGSCLDRASLRGAVLQGVDFSDTSCREADFTESHLDCTTVFKGARMTRCNFRRMSLKGLHMKGTDLEEAYFDGADLTGADLSYANLKKAHFTQGACLVNACLANACLQESDFTGAVLGSSMDSSSLAADLTDAYMPDAVFNRADLNGVNMSGVNWYGSHAGATGAYMHHVNFTGANLGTMNFAQADLKGCIFDRAVLIGTNFRGAVLRPGDGGRRVSFADASVQGADFFASEIEDAIFTNAAAAVPVEWYFSLDGKTSADYRNMLNHDNEPVFEELREVFSSHGINLAKNAYVKVDEDNYKWRIMSGTGEPVYQITMEFGLLQVRGGIDGVPLMSMGDREDFVRQLDRCVIPPGLQGIFKDSGYGLDKDAAVYAVKAGLCWSIDNGTLQQTKLKKGYLEFYVVRKPGVSLDVYGTVFGTVRIGPGHVYEQQRNVMAATKWIPDLLKGESICPNGQNISVVTDKRPSVRMTWEQVLKAASLPKEPECIPGPMTWCSRERGCNISVYAER